MMNYATIDEAWGDLSGTLKKKKNKTKDPICELYEQKVNSSAYSQLDLVNNANAEYEKSRYQRTMRPLPNSEETEREPRTKKVDINPYKKYYDISSTDTSDSKGSDSIFEKQFEIKHPKLFDSDYEQVDQEECKKKKYYDIIEDRQDRDPYYASVTAEEHARPRRHYDDEDDLEEYVYKRQGPKPSPSRPKKGQAYFEEYLDDVGYGYKDKKPKLMYVDIMLYLISGIILIFLLEQFVQIGINMQH